jgi:hypothetical protein
MRTEVGPHPAVGRAMGLASPFNCAVKIASRELAVVV